MFRMSMQYETDIGKPWMVYSYSTGHLSSTVHTCTVLVPIQHFIALYRTV
jgi:hypothetical protein